MRQRRSAARAAVTGSRIPGIVARRRSGPAGRAVRGRGIRRRGSVTRGLLVVVLSLVPVAARATVAGAQGEVPVFDGRSTQDTVRVVVGSLVGVAAVVFVGLVMFVWHTSPRRRLRAAVRRAQRLEGASDDTDLLAGVLGTRRGEPPDRSRVAVPDEGGAVALEEVLADLDGSPGSGTPGG